MPENSIFKKCPTCKYVWNERDGFLTDPTINIIGYQINTQELLGGYILFNHGCNNTLAIQVRSLCDLYNGTVYPEFMIGKTGCPGYCNKKFELLLCTNACESAYVREIIQIVKNWPKEKFAAMSETTNTIE